MLESGCPFPAMRGREYLGGSIAKLLILILFFFPSNVICFLLPLIVSYEVINEENVPFPKSLSFMLPTCTRGSEGEI